MNLERLAQLRRDFTSRGLDESEVARDPFEQFRRWMDEALSADIIDANAMNLATVGPDGRPSSRIVLLKGFDRDGLVFFTNYESRKGRDFAANPFAAVNFFWPQLDRQIAVSGSVERTSREESEAYFHSRPLESRFSALASQQSAAISSRADLERRVAELREQYGDSPPCPAFWGGFRVRPDRFEFWQGRPNRLHDRIEYRLAGGRWEIRRLSP
jgi:pyridoxamine 5'-phosphate oxidase